MSRRVLVIAKHSREAQLDPEERRGLIAAGIIEGATLAEAHRLHEQAVADVLAALAGHDARLVRVDSITPDDFTGLDLAITVGGDGTVFAVHDRLVDIPLITVNSDPDRSIGSYTRIQVDAFPALLRAWEDGTAIDEFIPRLGVAFDDGPRRLILNDCLFTNVNPAAICRYRIACDGVAEMQRSSGVWVATRSGATAAITSAGFPAELRPDPINGDALLYLVREPLQISAPLTLLRGCQQPARSLTLTAGSRHLHLFIDGCHLNVPLTAGSTALFSPAQRPLRLLRPA